MIDSFSASQGTIGLDLPPGGEDMLPGSTDLSRATSLSGDLGPLAPGASAT